MNKFILMNLPVGVSVSMFSLWLTRVTPLSVRVSMMFSKSTDTGYVVRASVNGKLTAVTKSDIAVVTTE